MIPESIEVKMQAALDDLAKAKKARRKSPKAAKARDQFDVAAAAVQELRLIQRSERS